MRKSFCSQALLAMLALTGSAVAQAQNSADALYLRSSAGACAACHGSDGRTVPGSAVPALAGRSAEELQAQMKAFKDGSRPATVMHQIARGLSDAQLVGLSNYFAAQPK